MTDWEIDKKICKREESLYINTRSFSAPCSNRGAFRTRFKLGMSYELTGRNACMIIVAYMLVHVLQVALQFTQCYGRSQHKFSPYLIPFFLFFIFTHCLIAHVLKVCVSFVRRYFTRFTCDVDAYLIRLIRVLQLR